MHAKKPLTYLLYIIIFLCSFSIHAQNDSLQGKSYEELIKLYENALFKNTEAAKTYAKTAYRLAKEENNSKKIGWSMYYIAYADSYIPLYEKALEGVQESLEIATKLNDQRLLFKNHNLRGNILSDTKKEIEALNEYFKAREYAALSKNNLDIITVSVNIAYIKKIHKNHQEAIDILKENLVLLNKLDDKNPKKEIYQQIVLMNIADSYLRINNPQEAANYNQIAIEMCNDEISTNCLAILMNEAIINYQNGNYPKTIAISNEVAEGFLKSKNKNFLITPYLYLGKSYYEQEKYQKTIRYLEDAIKIATDHEIVFSDQKDAHKLLHLSYTKIGNIEKATENFNRYTELDIKNDSLDIQVTKKIHKEHDIIPLQEEIDSLGTYANYLYGASAILLLTLVGFFIWYKFKQKKNRTRFQELLVTIEQLEQVKEKTAIDITVKETTNLVTDENALQILKGLETFETKELYLRQDCTLSYVAKKLKTNTSYLSNVINTYKEKSFKSYLSELRINAALIKLKNEHRLRSYTIKAIAEEFGFKRSETFSRAFKAQTGMYPSYYIKNLDNQNVT